jgi:hypothetical protein
VYIQSELRELRGTESNNALDGAFRPPEPNAFNRPSSANKHNDIDWGMVEKARQEWRQSVHYPGEGNHRFFEFSVALRAAGMNLFDIERMLESEVHHARSPNERRDQIPSIMNSLKQSWKKAG